MSDQETTNDWQVTLTIPCAAEYVGTARLTILGIASRLNLSYDQAEDVRLAAGEACTNAIERYRQRGHAAANGASPTITIRARSDAASLMLEVEDNVGGGGTGGEDLPETDAVDVQEIGALLMEILVDEFAVRTMPSGSVVVRLVKHMAEV